MTTNLLQRECNKFGSIYNIKWDSGIIEKYLEKKLKEKWQLRLGWNYVWINWLCNLCNFRLAINIWSVNTSPKTLEHRARLMLRFLDLFWHKVFHNSEFYLKFKKFENVFNMYRLKRTPRSTSTRFRTSLSRRLCIYSRGRWKDWHLFVIISLGWQILNFRQKIFKIKPEHLCRRIWAIFLSCMLH